MQEGLTKNWQKKKRGVGDREADPDKADQAKTVQVMDG